MTAGSARPTPAGATFGGAAVGPMLYLSGGDLAALGVSMVEVVEALDAGCRTKGNGKVVMPPKLTLRGRDGAFSQAMAASLGDSDVLGVKWVTVFPSNPRRGLPLTNGLVVLSEGETGLPVAVMDGGPVTAWRTGAAAGVAVRYLARPDVERVGVLGCGVQGRSAVRALAAVLPDMHTVRCCDALSAAAAGFADELRAELPCLEFAVCAAPEDVVRGAGVVVTAITMGEAPPPLGPGLLEPGALAVALDYDAAWSAAAMTECDRFYCDDTAGVLATRAAGVRLGGIPAQIAGDLGELAAGRVAGRRGADERLFCMNLGMALEDVVTARLALERARALGVGLKLPR